MTFAICLFLFQLANAHDTGVLIAQTPGGHTLLHLPYAASFEILGEIYAAK